MIVILFISFHIKYNSIDKSVFFAAYYFQYTSRIRILEINVSSIGTYRTMGSPGF